MSFTLAKIESVTDRADGLICVKYQPIAVAGLLDWPVTSSGVALIGAQDPDSTLFSGIGDNVASSMYWTAWIVRYVTGKLEPTTEQTTRSIGRRVIELTRRDYLYYLQDELVGQTGWTCNSQQWFTDAQVRAQLSSEDGW